jgi:hypothetical protein
MNTMNTDEPDILAQRSSIYTRRDFLASACAAGASLLPGALAAMAEKQDGVHPPFAPIPTNQVKIGGLIGERIECTWRGNILALDVDKDFLAAVFDKKFTGRFIGLGMFSDALVRLAFYTNEPALLALKKRVVATIVSQQEPDGYLGNITPEKRISKAWDIHALSYFIYALTSDYRLFGERASLEAARKAADYMVSRLAGKLPGAVDISTIHLAMLMTGFDRAMLALHAATNDQRYLDVLVKDAGIERWDQEIVQGRKPPYYGHAYAYLCRCLAQLELYRRNGNPQLLAPTDKVLKFLRSGGGLVVTGSAGKSECWHSDQSGDGELTETCATAYLIRWLDQLQRMRADSLYGDMMERAIYNALFAAQSPDGRRLRYWSPFEGPRVYYKNDSYCCPSNFRRIIADLPGMVYYRSADGGLVVNLYTESSVRVELARGLKLEARQQTDYPNSGTVLLHLNPSAPATFPVQLRIPRWCGHATLLVNGMSMAAGGPGFAELRRRWKPGDTIELNLDMPWRLVRGFAKQEGRAAVTRGPLLYCLNLRINPTIGEGDVRELTLDERSFRLITGESTLRRTGTACEARARLTSARPGDGGLPIKLTEFPDPAGIATYFLVRPDAPMSKDELLG